MSDFWTWVITPSMLLIYGCCIPSTLYSLIHFHFMHAIQKNLTLSFPPPERQRFIDTNHRRIMEHGKYDSTMRKRSLGHNQYIVNMVLGLFMDNMTTDFPNQVAIDEWIENNLKRDNIQIATVDILPLPLQEQRRLPHQRPTQSNQNLTQKQVIKRTMIKKRDVLTMIQFLCLMHISCIYWLMLGQLCANRSSLLSFATIVSMIPIPHADTMLGTKGILQKLVMLSRTKIKSSSTKRCYASHLWLLRRLLRRSLNIWVLWFIYKFLFL